MNLTLSSTQHGKTIVLAVAGKIDQLSADHFRELLPPHLASCGAEQNVLLLDLSGVDYVSSAGLRIFMLAAREIKPRHGRLALVGLQPAVREIFEISKFSLLFLITRGSPRSAPRGGTDASALAGAGLGGGGAGAVGRLLGPARTNAWPSLFQPAARPLAAEGGQPVGSPSTSGRWPKSASGRGRAPPPRHWSTA